MSSFLKHFDWRYGTCLVAVVTGLFPAAGIVTGLSVALGMSIHNALTTHTQTG